MLNLVKEWHNQASYTLYVAIDVETGGLAHSTNETNPELPEGVIGAQGYPILEITAKFYDGNYEEVSEPMTFVIHHSLDYLNERCSDWVKNTFGDTLFHECAASNTSLQQADKAIADRVREIQAETSYILGNSVDLDRSFVHHQMKELIGTLHYRIFDVSTLKIMFKDMFGDIAKYQKRETHRTESDITETMEELAFYRKNFIKSREQVVIDLSRPRSKILAK